MTYLELYEDALRKLHKSLITLGEFEMMVKPLNREVEADPKTGKWETDVDRWGVVETSVNGYRCSECGEFDPCKDNYCPNCGARMRGEEE